MASASSRRVGARLAPFTNSRSPLTVKVQWWSPTWRRPVRTRVAWLSTSSANTSTVRWVRGCAPSDHGHHSAGLSTPNCQVTSLTPWARPWAKSRSTRSSTMVRSRTERVSAESSSACSCSTARSSWASWHTTRSLEMRTGPVRSTRTGRHRPPGFQSASMQSQCWKTPVMLRLAARSRCGLHVTSMNSECSDDRPARSVMS